MDIFVQKDGHQQGPFPETKVREGIDAGEFVPTDLAWTTGKASWQPLSALINLDVNQPPPILATQTLPKETLEGTQHGEQSGVIFGPQGMSPAFSTPVLSPNAASPLGRRACRQCGAPYNLFSLTHAWGSGLCRRCSKAAAKSNQDPIYTRPIFTRQDAFKVIRATAIVYLLLGLLNIVLTWLDILDSLYLAYVMIIGSLVLWLWHSRIAAIVLLLIPIGGVLFLILAGEGRFLINLGLWNAITVLQIMLAWKAVAATIKLHRVFADKPDPVINADRSPLG